MVATRRSKASHAEIEHHAHEEEPEPVVVENSDSDSDEAPEEVTLTTSRNKALRERREQRQVRQHAQRVEKNKRSRAQPSNKEEETEQELDILPEGILEAVAREDEEEGFESDEEDQDRRTLQRRIVTEQLRQGIVQARKKKFKERRVGPVTVKSLHNAENPSTRAADAARSFLQERMGRVERRAVSGLRQRDRGNQKTFSYF